MRRRSPSASAWAGAAVGVPDGTGAAGATGATDGAGSGVAVGSGDGAGSATGGVAACGGAVGAGCPAPRTCWAICAPCCAKLRPFFKADANCEKSNFDFFGDELVAGALERAGALVRPVPFDVEDVVNAGDVVDRGALRAGVDVAARVGRAVDDDEGEGEGAASLMNSKKLIAFGRHYEWNARVRSVRYGTNQKYRTVVCYEWRGYGRGLFGFTSSNVVALT